MQDIKKKTKKILKINTVTEIPFINIHVPINTTAREKRKTSIMGKIINNLPDSNDKCYIEHDRGTIKNNYNQRRSR